MKIDTPYGVSKIEKQRFSWINPKGDFRHKQAMRAQARTSFRALVLILLMLTSTQLVLLTARDYTPKELDPPPQRLDVLDNSEVVKIMLADSHGCAIGSENQMKCWGAGGYGKTGHENSADYGDEELEMGQYLMFTDVGSNLTFTDVGTGHLHTCALLHPAAPAASAAEGDADAPGFDALAPCQAMLSMPSMPSMASMPWRS